MEVQTSSIGTESNSVGHDHKQYNPEPEPPNPTDYVPRTDEELQEQARLVVCSHFQEELAKQPDTFYDPNNEYLRTCWEKANIEARPRVDTTDYYYKPPHREDHIRDVEANFRRIIHDDQELLAQDLRKTTPEYKAQMEADRLRQEELEAKQEEKMAIWEESQRRRRIHDAEIKPRRVNRDILCHEMEEYHAEFFEQFFSEDYCGWKVEFDSVWKGYTFPWEAGGNIHSSFLHYRHHLYP